MHGLRAAQPVAGPACAFAHLDRHAAVRLHHGKAALVRDIVTGKHRGAAGERRFAQEGRQLAHRRDILGLPKRKGRHPVLDEQQDTELWRRWKALNDATTVDLEDESSILDATMDLAEVMSLPLSVVWASIKSWVDQGLG